jgi:nitrogen regulatory protein PII
MLQPVKKLEIVIHDGEIPAITKVFSKCGISGYTIIPNIMGRGAGGLSGDDLQGNSYIMAICTEEAQATAIMSKLEPILKRMGGICVVTDANWIVHQ